MMISSFHLTTLIAVALIVSQTIASPYDRDIVLEGAIGQITEASRMAQHYSSLAEVLGHKSKYIEGEAEIYEVVGEVKKIIDEWESTFVLAKLMKEKPPQEAIHLFNQLPSGIIQCNFAGYMILARNYAAAVGTERYLKPTDQIKSSVWAAIEAHGQICRWDYFRRFSSALDQINPKVKDELKELFNHELLDKIFPKDLKEALRITNLLGRFKNIASEPLLDRLSALVEGKPEAKYLKSIPSDASLGNLKSEFETNIVEKYLTEPCRTLVFELNDILEPAKLDLALEDDFLNEINPEHSYLLKDYWKRYLFCSMLNNNYIAVAQELANKARGRF